MNTNVKDFAQELSDGSIKPKTTDEKRNVGAVEEYAKRTEAAYRKVTKVHAKEKKADIVENPPTTQIKGGRIPWQSETEQSE